MARKMNMQQFRERNYDILDMEGEWLASFGELQANAKWLIYGLSGNGKTDFCVKLAKYLSGFDRVAYMSSEEGDSGSLQRTFDRNDMWQEDVELIYEIQGMAEVFAILKRRRSPKIVILDSLDYLGLKVDEYKELVRLYPKKMFIIVSWSDGRKPKTKAAQAIEYMADVKVEVTNYVAFPRSRFGGNSPFVIWRDKAKEFHHWV